MNTPNIWYGANFKIVGKTDPQNLSYPGAFIRTEGTFSTLASHISSGLPWTIALLDEGKPRQQVYANEAWLLGADIDSGMTIASAIAHPFISAHCGLGIESASSRIFDAKKNPDSHEKFRLVFRLAKPVIGWQTIRICLRYLIHLLGVADPACKDSHRFFFGAPGRKAFLLKEGNTLPETFVDDAKAWHQKNELEEQRRVEIERRQWEEWRHNNPESDNEVEEALSYIPHYTPGQERYSSLIAMIGGVLSTFGESEGSAILRRWDGGRGQWGRGGFDRILRSVARSHTDRKATLGTLFYLAAQDGYRPKVKPKGIFKLPDFREPDLAEYQDYLRWEQEQQQVESAQRLHNVFNPVVQWLKQAKPRGFGFKPLKTLGNTDIVEVSSHAEGHLLAEERGARLIVNLSGTGAFKSTFYSQITPEFFGVERVIVALPDALNPPVEQFKEWHLLEGRHLGNVIDKDGKLRRATPETSAAAKVDSANCDKAFAIQLMSDRNPHNPSYMLACLNCPHNWRCGKEEGPGFGARYQASQAFKHPLIRTGYGRLQGQGDEANILKNSVLILDESSSKVIRTKILKVSRRDIGDKLIQVDKSGESTLQDLKPLLHYLMGEGWQHGDRIHGTNQAKLEPILKPYLPEKIDWQAVDRLEDDTEELQTFGLKSDLQPLDDKELRRLKKLQQLKWLPLDQHREMEQLESLQKRTKEQYQRLQTYRKYALTPALEQERDKLQERYDATKREYLSPSEMQNKAGFLTKRWLRDFLLVLTGSTGHIHWGRDGITLTLENDQHLAAIAAAQKVVLSDASELQTKAALSEKYGIPENEIFIFKVKQPQGGRVETVHVTGLGKLGKNRGEGLEQCRQALVAKFKELDPTHATFDWKQFEADGVLFRDTVGSNAFKTCKSISTVLPRPNINALLAEYCVLKNTIVDADDEGFQTYYRSHIKEALVQTRGRLREQLRPGENMTLYIMGDDDIPIEGERTVAAADFTIDAARKGEKSVRAIADAARWVMQQGQELTQSAVARATTILGLKNGEGYTQQYLSKIWDKVLSCLQLFLGNIYKKGCSPPQAVEKVEAIIPIVEEIAQNSAPEALDEVITWLSPHEWAYALEQLTTATQQKLLQCWVSLLPTGYLEAITP